MSGGVRWQSTSVQLAMSSFPSPLSLLLVLMIVWRGDCVPTADFTQGNNDDHNSNNNNNQAVGMRATGTGRPFWSPSARHGLEKRSRDVQQPIQLCGYRLLEAVRGLCRGNYVGYNRRSDPDMRDDRLPMMMMMMRDSPAEQQLPHHPLYKISHERGQAEGRKEERSDEERDKSSSPPMNPVLAWKRGEKHDGSVSTSTSSSSQHLLRFRRNIIDECCKKPCSVNEMLRYCGRN